MAPAGIGADLEGIHAVEAALAAGRVIALQVEAGRTSSPEIASIVEQAKKTGVRVEVVDDVRPFAVTSVPQGLVAQARPIINHSLEALNDPSPCLLVVLDHLEDPHNVGAIARSAVAAGATGLVVPTRRAPHWARRLSKRPPVPSSCSGSPSVIHRRCRSAAQEAGCVDAGPGRRW